ncbi:MAG: L,D-transpeptidase, partial [bacterium]
LGVVNSYKIIEYIPGDSAIPLTISPPPLCTVPSFAQFEILPTPDPKKVIIFLSSTESLVYDFNPGGGTLEIPDIEFDYLPVRMEVRAPQLTEVFNFVLYSERWIEIFCDYDIQCAVMWEGARPRIWTVVTTGKSNWTRAEHCRIMNKEPVAYFVLDRSPMRWWMGIQNVHGTQNGTHAPLSGTWWRLGRQGSHGCVRNPFAEKFYQLMEVGDRVEVYYRHSEGFNITEINPAWRYLRFDLLEEIEDSSDLKQYVHRASEILMPLYQEKLAKAWQEDSVNCNQTAEYQNHP